jgi:beta-glucosidase
MLPTVESLSLAQQVAQMIIVRACGHLFDQQIQYPAWEPPTAVLQHWVADMGVGGVILLGGSAVEVGLRSHQLQRWAKIPLLIAADIEEGVGQRFPGATQFPPPMALGAIATQDPDRAIALAEQMGSVTAQEALAIGINWVLAPVVDVNNNPQNPVINVRAFGETVAQVSQLTTAFIRGSQTHPVLTAAKHFPGHGDTAIDSHLKLPVLPHSQQRLDQVELPPFRAAIAAGVDAVMTAHLQIPVLDATYPATLSPAILTQLLRQQLAFGGLIVTDALIMGAIANRYGTAEAAILAVAAGADVLMMPPDPIAAIEGICAAVETGRISGDRIQASVERIWRAKQKVCSPIEVGDITHAWESIPPMFVDVQAIPERLAQPAAIALSQQILRESMQVYRPEGFQGLKVATDDVKNLIVVDDGLHCDFLGRQAPAIVLPQQRGYHLQVVDQHALTLAPPTRDDPPFQTLMQLFIRGNPFRGSADLSQIAIAWLHRLVELSQLQALIVYGSPYVLEQVRPAIPTLIPYVFTYGQMAEAQTLALNALLGSALNFSNSDRGSANV